MTVAGVRHDVPRPFHVLATQNPLEQEGTYPLPEAQLDRFLMEIDVDYPSQDAERKILFDTTGADETRAKAMIDGRLAPSVDDVMELAEPVLKHRMALTFAARAEGETASGVINRLTAALG